jgi:eukaryotic-like serine/threonine-protein kinase
MARSASQPGNGDGTHFGEGASDANAEQPPGEQLGVGSIIAGKYRLERLLGEGGMGAVWRAQHLQLELPVAIKLLRAGGDKANLSERLKIEARAIARLSHPAIVRVFDIDASESGEPFIVMELLEGESLSDLCDRDRLSAVVAVQTLLPIAEGLALAHAKGIVHRDLKPHNVFITRADERVQPKLLDFGIAKLTTSPLPTGNLTETGVLLGSPDYMSPEQARGKNDVDFRADIWQFCVVLYEAISGTTPFEGENYNALMRAIVEDEPAPLPLDNGVDQRLSDLIAWGMSKDREQRPASIQELARALAEWLLDRGINEDITFAPLGQKWLASAAQKFVPVRRSDGGDEAEPTENARGDTLLSPRLPARVLERPAPSAVESALAPPARRAGRGLVALVLALLAIGLIWAANRGSRPPSAALPSSPRGSVPAAPSASPSPVVELAATAPQPPIAAPLTSASGTSVSRAASPAHSSKPSAPKPAGSSVGPSTAPQPARDGHDETHELLQAY